MIRRNNVFFGIAILALSRMVIACEAVDGRFVPVGEIVTINDQSVAYSFKSLAVMLDAAFESKVGDPTTISIHLKVDPKEQIAYVTHELSFGSQGRQKVHNVVCEGDEWMFEKSGKLSAEGSYRTYDAHHWVKVLPDGSLLVRNEINATFGLIFKSKKFFSVATKFAPFTRK